MGINGSGPDSNVRSVRKSIECIDWILNEQKFIDTLFVEKSRAIRNNRTVGLAVVNFKDCIRNNTESQKKSALESIGKTLINLRKRIRDGDSIGWIIRGREIGVLFTDIKSDDRMTLEKKLVDHFHNEGMLSPSLNLIKFPDDANRDDNIEELSFNDFLKKKACSGQQ
jgi:hypothetical protein